MRNKPGGDMNRLRLEFDPMTIEHLGLKMYSHLPNAIAELVANAYDADASNVEVVIADDGHALAVADDGHGMSLVELQENYLRIGRNRREATHSDKSESGRRRVAGRKGLGKLAVFGIGNRIVVETKRSGDTDFARVSMVWNDIRRATGTDYEPDLTMINADRGSHFTRIRIESLNRVTEIKPSNLAESLSRLFNYTDDDFHITVRRGRVVIPVDRRLRYATIEKTAEWVVPDQFTAADPPGVTLSGTIIASARPLPANLRGVTLYVRGRMANEPEFFGVPESSQAFSYLTGFVDADDLDLESDVISTDRRAVNWENDAATAVRSFLAAVVREAARKRRDLRAKENEKKLQDDLSIDVERWTASIRGPEGAAVERVLRTLTSPDNEIEDRDRRTIAEGLREIAPEYADLHWRALHASIQEAAEQQYKSGNYHHAVVEAIKRYVKDVRSVAGKGADVDELSVIHAAFSAKAPLIDIVQPYASLALSPTTERNMREGHAKLSEAVWTGFRNPLQHEEVKVLLDAGAFSYQDCLDALSVVSHLRRRVDLAGASGVQLAED